MRLRIVLAALLGLLLAVALAQGLLILFTGEFVIRRGSLVINEQSLLPSTYVVAGLLLALGVLCRDRVSRWYRDHVSPESGQISERATKILLVVLLISGFILRIARLGTVGLNPDEAQLVWAAKASSLRELWQIVTEISPHPFPFFALLHAMAGISDNIAWLRLVSIIPGTLLIVASYGFGARLHGRTAGLVIAMLVSLSPGLIDLSRVCRNYAIPSLFMVAAFWFVLDFLESRKWRSYSLYVLCMAISVSFHYGFVAALAGANLALLIIFALRRYGFRTWLWAGLAQTPLAALLAFYYFVHISDLPTRLIRVLALNSQRALTEPTDSPLDPLLGLYGYLLPAQLAGAFVTATLFGCVYLLLRRHTWQTVICLAPIGAAYVFMWLDRVPFGESRHSSYLSIVLFALIAPLVPECLAGFPQIRTWLRAISRAAPAAEASAQIGDGPTRRMVLRAVGTSICSVLAVGYTFVCLAEYESTPTRASDLGPPHRRHAEFLTYYKVADIERTFAILEEHGSERDMVMLTFPGLMAFRLHLGIRPQPNPPSDAGDAPTIQWPFVPSQSIRYVHDGVSYYFYPPYLFTPDVVAFAKAVQVIRAEYNLQEVRKVWCLQGGIESVLGERFKQEYPSIPMDDATFESTSGILFGIEAKYLDQVLRQ